MSSNYPKAQMGIDQNGAHFIVKSASWDSWLIEPADFGNGAYRFSFHSYSLHLIRSNLTFSFSYSHTASLFLIDMVNSTLLFSFPCCYISLDRHNFPSTAHFLLPCSIIHLSHHMECIFMSENIFSKLCLISFLLISACFHRYLWPMSIFCPFYAIMILASLFSDKLASSL